MSHYSGTWTLALITPVTQKGGLSFSELCFPNETERGESMRFYNSGGVGQGGVGKSSVGLHKPCTTLALWLGWTLCNYGTWNLALITQSLTVMKKGGTSSSELCLPNTRLRKERGWDFYNIGGVGKGGVVISSVGLCEPRSTSALSFGWMPWYHSMWTLVLITRSLTVRQKGGTSSSEMCPPNETKKDVCHGDVGINNVGLCEPHASLALWLGWTPRYHDTWTLACSLSHWKYDKMEGCLLQSCTFPMKLSSHKGNIKQGLDNPTKHPP
jgi:hypothetical protein